MGRTASPVTAIVAAGVGALAVAGCSTPAASAPPTSTTLGSPATTTTAPTSAQAVDPGVRAYHPKLLRPRPTAPSDPRVEAIVVGRVVREGHDPRSGEVDSFMAVHEVTVEVKDVLRGDLGGLDTVTVGNGMYEWAEGGESGAQDARRLTEPGEPWLEPGDAVVLVVGTQSPSESVGGRRHTAHGAAGTYRVVDGRVSGAPRTASMQEAPGLPALLVGRTTDDLASSL